MDEDLLQRRPALAAELDGERATVEASLDRGPSGRVPAVARDAAAEPLELGLQRLEHVGHVGAGTRLQLELGRREGQVHAARMTIRLGRPLGRVARPGTRADVRYDRVADRGQSTCSRMRR